METVWDRKKCTIEDFTTINNGAGDVILGDKVRIGIGSVVIGPVTIKDGCGLGQHVFISGFNHCYQDGTKNSSIQPLDKKEVIIDEDTHIGANAVVVAGVHIGKRCQIGAGSVVTKDIPDYSIAVGNPARVIKRYDLEQKQWIKIWMYYFWSSTGSKNIMESAKKSNTKYMPLHNVAWMWILVIITYPPMDIGNG